MDLETFKNHTAKISIAKVETAQKCSVQDLHTMNVAWKTVRFLISLFSL